MRSSTSKRRGSSASEQTGQFKTFCCDVVGNVWTLRRHFGDLKAKIIAGAGGVDSRARSLGQRILATRGSKRAPALALVSDEHTLPETGTDDKYREALAQSPDAIEWLRVARGFDDATIERARYGLRQSKDGREWIAIPQYLPDGRLAGFKYRILPWHMADPDNDRRFAREKGSPTVLYGAQRLGRSTSVVIYEAEMDADSGDQLGLPTGLASTGGANTWLPEWTALLAGIDTIFLAHDADEAGEDGAGKVAEALGSWRCRRVHLPLKDMNACLAAGLGEEVKHAFASAQPMDHPLIVRPSKYAQALQGIDPAVAKGRDTGLRVLNALIGGRRGGELTVVSGHTGQGKTTATTFLAWLASTKGEPALIGSFEHPPEDESLKLVTMEAGESFVDLEDKKRERVIAAVHKKPLYLIDAYGSMSWDTVWDTFRYFYYACGGRVAVIDHLDYVIDRADNDRRPRHEIIDEFITRLIGMLKQELKQLHVYLVVHPKVEDKVRGKAPPVTKDSLKGGGAVKQKPDNVLIVRKARRLDGKYRSYWLFDKVRHILGTEGEIVLGFDKPALRFQELQPPPAPPTPAPSPISGSHGNPSQTAKPQIRGPKIDYQKLAANDRDDD